MSGRDRVFHWVTYNLWYIDWYMQGHGLYYWLVYGVSLTVCYITDGVLNDVCCVAYALSSYNVMNTMHTCIQYHTGVLLWVIKVLLHVVVLCAVK